MQLFVRALRLVVSRARPSQRSLSLRASARAQWHRPRPLRGADKQDRAGGENTRCGPVALRPGLGEIDFDCLVWIKKRRHYPPCGAYARGLTQLVAGIFLLMFVNLAGHSTNLRSELSAVAEHTNGSRRIAPRRARSLSMTDARPCTSGEVMDARQYADVIVDPTIAEFESDPRDTFVGKAASALGNARKRWPQSSSP